jgi:large subunit ribosomal protein L15
MIATIATCCASRRLEMSLNDLRPRRAASSTTSGAAAAARPARQDRRPRRERPARRAGGYHKVGFEGGQMPLQRRLPKIGSCHARRRSTGRAARARARRFAGKTADLASLQAAGLVSKRVVTVKVIA